MSSRRSITFEQANETNWRAQRPRQFDRITSRTFCVSYFCIPAKRDRPRLSASNLTAAGGGNKISSSARQSGKPISPVSLRDSLHPVIRGSSHFSNLDRDLLVFTSLCIRWNFFRRRSIISLHVCRTGDCCPSCLFVWLTIKSSQCNYSCVCMYSQM